MRIIAALTLSAALISVAAWNRFADVSPSLGVLSVVNSPTASSSDAFLNEFMATTGTSTPPEDLTGTDLIGRQLIMDYVAMARNGQVTDENLTALAERYVESIPTLISTQKVDPLDLKIVANTKENFSSYASSFDTIYRAYSTAFADKYLGRGIETESVSSDFAVIYENTAAKLKTMAVPAELAEPHLALIDTYLENASAMKALSKSESDPSSSFAGIIVLQSNLEKEQSAIDKIESVLNQNGI